MTEGKVEESVPDLTTLEETDEQLVLRPVPNCRVTSVEPSTGLVKATTGKNDHRQQGDPETEYELLVGPEIAVAPERAVIDPCR